MCSFDWGDTLGEICDRVRKAACGMFNGMIVVLPELTNEMGAGLEIVFGLEDDAMRRLKVDQMWKKHARVV